MRRSLERQFDRYRTKGDLGALAVVFDRTARDLLALAQHLVRDVDDAEDLVQSTFVTAIQRARSFDGSKSLLPWLSGILAHHASNHIRDRLKRRADELPAIAGSAGDPRLAAERSELDASLLEALARMDERYQRVLAPYLSKGETPDQIATRLGIAPGTVRAQIHRGLVRLRQMLPAGVSASLIGLSAPGLETVRARVLEHGAAATSAAGKAATGATGGVAVLGGMIVMKKAILVAALALIAATSPLWLPSSALVQGSQQTSVPETLDDSGEAHPELRLAGVTASRQGREPASPVRAASEAPSPGRIIIALRVKGVAETDLDDLSFKVTRRSQRASSKSMLNASRERRLALNDLASQRRRNEAQLAALTAAGADNLLAEKELEIATQARAVLQSEWSNLNEVVHEEVPVPATRLPSEEQLHHAGGPTAVKSNDVVFEFDASAARLVEHPNDTIDSLRIDVIHEVYFEATAEIDLGPAIAARARQGEIVRLSSSVTLAPAAVLTGQVSIPTAAKREVLIRSVLGLEQELQAQQASLSAQTDDDPPAKRPSITRVQQLRLMEERHVELATSLDRLQSMVGSRAVVGLFRQGAREPVGHAKTNSKGEFRIKLPEEGAFIVAAIAKGWTVEQAHVDLQLAELVSLPSKIELTQNHLTTAVIEDFGAFPRGGLPLQITRVATPLDQSIDWKAADLIWSGGQIVRRFVETASLKDGSITVRGLSPGPHRIELSPGALCAFNQSRRDSLSTHIPIPSTGAVIALPISVLEVSLEWPGSTETTAAPELLFGPNLQPVKLPGASRSRSSRTLILTDPRTPLTLTARSPGFQFDAWSGTTPARGMRGTASIIGRIE